MDENPPDGDARVARVARPRSRARPSSRLTNSAQIDSGTPGGEGLDAPIDPSSGAPVLEDRPKRRRRPPSATPAAGDADAADASASPSVGGDPITRPTPRRKARLPPIQAPPEDGATVLEVPPLALGTDGTEQPDSGGRRLRKKKGAGKGKRRPPPGSGEAVPAAEGSANLGYVGGLNLAEFEEDLVSVHADALAAGTTTALGSAADGARSSGIGSTSSARDSMAYTPRVGPPISGGTSFSMGGLAPSVPASSFFVEGKAKFRAQDKQKLAEQLELNRKEAERREKEDERSIRSTLNVALSTHTFIRKVGTLTQGLLAGFAMWNLVVALVLYGPVSNYSDSAFANIYYRFGLPVQSIFYVLLTPSLLVLLDRMDAGRPSKLCLIRSLTLQLPSIALLLYFAALICSLVAIPTEDRLSTYGTIKKQNYTNLTVLYNFTSDNTTSASISGWEGLSIARTVCVFLGWIIIAIVAPRADRLKLHMQISGNQPAEGAKADAEDEMMRV